jgi:hypothetical protein
VYLAGRWLEGDPAAQFCFAQIAKPGPRRKEIGASIVTMSRSTGQLRGALARIAQVARQIVACYERSLGVPFVSGLSGLRPAGALPFAVVPVALLVVCRG